VTDETTYGLSPDRLAHLLAMGMENSALAGDREDAATPAAFLQEMLAGRLPHDPADPDSSPSVFNKPSDNSPIPSGQTTQELLLGETTSLAFLSSLKDSAKKLARGGVPEGKQAAAIAVYYAAVASALVFQNAKITKRSYREVREAYAKLEQKSWIPSELKEMFKEAGRMCLELEATEK